MSKRKKRKKRIGLSLIAVGLTCLVAMAVWAALVWGDDEARVAAVVPLTVLAGAGIAMGIAGAVVLDKGGHEHSHWTNFWNSQP